MKIWFIFFMNFLFIFQSFTQNQTIPGEFIVEPPTLICLGFEWYIDGDDNRNATAEVEYREQGKHEWNSCLPLLRIGNEVCGEPAWNYTTENMFAGSIMDLHPGTTYECRITLYDPDGITGDTQKTVTLKTRSDPKPKAFRLLHDTYESAIRYAFSIPGISTMVIGMENVDELERAAQTIKKVTALTEEEQNELYVKGLKILQSNEVWKAPYGQPAT